MAAPVLASLIESIQHHPGTWYAMVDLANVFFTIPISEEAQEQFAFTWMGYQYTFIPLPQGYIHSPTICHRQVAKTLEKMDLSPEVQLTHYIDDILLQGLAEENIQKQLVKTIETLNLNGWETNPSKIQGPATTVKFLGML